MKLYFCDRCGKITDPYYAYLFPIFHDGVPVTDEIHLCKECANEVAAFALKYKSNHPEYAKAEVMDQMENLTRADAGDQKEKLTTENSPHDEARKKPDVKADESLDSKDGKKPSANTNANKKSTKPKTITELLMEGKSVQEIVDITGFAKSSVYSQKYILRKQGRLPQAAANAQDQPEQDHPRDAKKTDSDDAKETPEKKGMVQEKPSTPKRKPKNKKATREQPLDYGKVGALCRAGWTIHEIADEMRVDDDVIANIIMGTRGRKKDA